MIEPSAATEDQAAIQATLEAAGIVFVDENGPGVSLRK
jgi:hypothetical protein